MAITTSGTKKRPNEANMDDKHHICLRLNLFKTSGGGGGCHKGFKEYAGWYFQVHVRVHLLRRVSSTCGHVGWLSPQWGWGEDGGFKKKKRKVGSLLGYLTMGGGGVAEASSGLLLRPGSPGLPG